MNKETKKSILVKILKWLYTNHREYDSGAEWREALVDFLEDLLK